MPHDLTIHVLSRTCFLTAFASKQVDALLTDLTVQLSHDLGQALLPLQEDTGSLWVKWAHLHVIRREF